jgi:ATP-dependent RNA helicase DOB1
VDVLLQCDVGAASTKLRAGQPFTAVTGIRPYSPDSAVSGSNGSAAPKAEYVIVPCLLSTIDGISHIRIFLPKDLKPPAAREGAFKNVKEVQRRFADGIQLLDPVENMGIKDPEFKDLLRKIETLEEAMRKNALYSTPELPVKYEQYAAKMEVVSQIRAIRKKIQAAESVMHLDELKQRKRVLRRLEFTTSDDVVEMKGRVACEISTGDEVSVWLPAGLSWLSKPCSIILILCLQLLLTELIFHGVFNDLSPEQCAALCSCFVFDEKSEKLPRLREELAGPLRRMQEFARNIAKVSKESKLEISEDEYVQSFKMGLMDAVFQWCKGAKFSEICKVGPAHSSPFSLLRARAHIMALLCTRADVGCLRRVSHSRLPALARAAEANGHGSQSDWQYRARGEIYSESWQAREAVVCRLQPIVVSVELGRVPAHVVGIRQKRK